MGLLYDVTYPQSADLDSGVPESYLDRLSEQLRAGDRRLVGASAVCINGEPHSMGLREDGEWRTDAEERDRLVTEMRHDLTDDLSRCRWCEEEVSRYGHVTHRVWCRARGSAAMKRRLDELLG